MIGRNIDYGLALHDKPTQGLSGAQLSPKNMEFLYALSKLILRLVTSSTKFAHWISKVRSAH